MKITLMFNPQAGGNALPVEDLVKGLERRGAEVFIQGTKEEDYAKALEEPCDFIIIAGGDGTIEKVAKKIIHKSKQVPIAILPFGNANNIAESLEVETSLDVIVNSWKKKDFRKFSVGSLMIDQERKEFFESVGWGLFAEVLNEVRAEKKNKKEQSIDNKDKVESGLIRLTQAVKELQPSYYQVFLDEIDYSGFYLWVEVMNTQSMGPQLQLAPEASHGDEFLDVVLVKEGERKNLEIFFGRQNGENNNNKFKPIQAKKIKIRSLQAIHIDDEMVKLEESSDKWVEISLIPQFFQIMNA